MRFGRFSDLQRLVKPSTREDTTTVLIDLESRARSTACGEVYKHSLTGHGSPVSPTSNANRVPRWTHRCLDFTITTISHLLETFQAVVLPYARSFSPCYVSTPYQVKLIFSPRDMLCRSLLESAVNSKEAKKFRAAMTTISKILTEEEVRCVVILKQPY